VGDLVKRFIATDLKEQQERLISRVSIFVLSIMTYLLAISVRGILQTLLTGLTITTPYTLILLMTIFWPKVCRRSHATVTLVVTMIALALWMLFPSIPSFFQGIHLPHPIYFCWMVRLVTFLMVAALDKNKIEGVSP
jgi:SSS family solute:Na+ symporter